MSGPGARYKRTRDSDCPGAGKRLAEVAKRQVTVVRGQHRCLAVRTLVVNYCARGSAG